MASIERCPVAAGTDFTDPDMIQSGVPLPSFATLRESRPLYWNPQTQEATGYTDGGFWLATRHEDVKAISCARTGWSSEENTAIVRFDGGTGPDALPKLASSPNGRRQFRLPSKVSLPMLS